MVGLHRLWLCVVLTHPVSVTTALPATDVITNPRPPQLSWALTPTNSTQQFRGLAPVTNKIVWISGTNATVLRTLDGGENWTNVSPTLSPGENSSDYQFRDIHAFSPETAVVLSIGEGNASRIYRTQNGGKSWDRTFVNDVPAAFYDCLAFEGEEGNEEHGLALSDPVDGKFRLIESWDAGKSWKVVDGEGMPPALAGEFAFAASGTCIEAKAGRWYIASGGMDPGRIFRSKDGHHWQASNSSITGGAAAGVFSVRFRDAQHGIAVGGDYEKPTGNADNAVWTRNGGKTWLKAERFPGGYRSGLSWVPGRRDAVVAVGTSGSDVSVDGGRQWHWVHNGTFDAVECVDGYGGGICWASGARGRVAKLDVGRL